MNRRRILLSYLANSFSWELYSKVYFYNELVPTTINGKNVLNKAKIVKVSGNGVIENQLVQISNIPSTNTTNGITFTKNDDGSLTISGTATSTFDKVVCASVSLTNGHKYLSITYSGSANYLKNWISGVASGETYNKGLLFTTTNNGNVSLYMTFYSGKQYNFTFYPQITDLTLREGTGNEPTTLTDNRIQNILNRGYIPYNTGTYKGTDIGEFSSEPYNLFDEEMSISGNSLISDNFTPIRYGGNYTVESTVSGRLDIYDENKNYLDYYSIPVGSRSFTNLQAHFVKFMVNTTTYNKTLCFHLTGTRTGYAPYKSFTPITFKAQLGGAINSHDTMEITSSAYVFTRNVLEYTFDGSETWNLYSTAFFYVTLSNLPPTNDGTYPLSTNGIVTRGNSATYARIRAYIADNPQLSTSSDMNSIYSSGTTVTYPLATPQVITIPRKHLGIVDLGSLNWQYSSSTQTFYVMNMDIVSNGDNSIANICCSKYMTLSPNDIVNNNKQGIGFSTNYYLRVRDTAYTDATTFKTAMAGTLLFYETKNEVADITDTIDIESGGTIRANWFSWVENQLFDHEKATTSSNNVIFTNNNDGSFTINGTASEDFTRFDWIVYGNNVDLSHKFLLYIGKDFNGSSSTYYANMPYGIGDIFGDYMFISLNNQTTAPYLNINLIIRYNGVSINKTIKPQLIDLTLAFGSGNEPTNVNDQRIQYIINKDYIPTNTTGTYREVSPSVLPNIDLLIKAK